MLIVEKVSLRWFLVFEDLYNGEGSLQANKASKKAAANFFNFLSFKKKRRKDAINQ